MHRSVRIALAVTLILASLAIHSSLDLECRNCEGITIASWNVQNLGPTKLDDGRAHRIASFISEHDIIIIQEITDASGRTAHEMCRAFENHSCIVSERTGSGTRKEQYLIASKYPLSNDRLVEHPDLERGILKADIDLGNRNITISTAHVKPDRVAEELRTIETLLNSTNVLAGDLNADCRYLPEGTARYFERMHWIIPDTQDTTPAASRCAYDRFVVSSDLLGYVSGYRIEHTPDGLSDHHAIVLVLS